MEEQKTISQVLELIANEICDNYCKHPSRYTSEEWFELIEKGESPCDKCPIMLLI